jgi:hypothetical protein
MKIHQLSLFLENSPGKALEACRVLADAGVNVRTLTLADTRQFGILRLILADWERARDLLQAAGFVVTVTEVVAVEVEDRPGGLVRLMECLGSSGVNVEYMYAFPFGRQGHAVLIFRFDRPDEAIELLRGSSINVLGAPEL